MLHVNCQVELSTPGAVDVELTELDGSVRRFPSDGRALTHEVVLWRLKSETTYAVRAVARGSDETHESSFTTDVLPGHARFRTHVEGTPSFPYVLSNHKCNGPAITYLLDDAGEMVWYQDVTAGSPGLDSGGVEGFTTTERGVLAVVGKTQLREFSWEGELLLDLSFHDELPFPIHHDVIRKDGRTYVLFAEQVIGEDEGRYVLDGLLVLDDQGHEIGRIRLADHVAPTGGGQLGGYWSALFPVAADYTHSNGLFLEEDGTIYWSLKHQDTLLKFVGDPDREDFGTLLWAASANPNAAFGNAFSFLNETSSPHANFKEQHHPNLDDQGRLLLFDNRTGLTDASRATVWEVDEDASTFTLTEAWELPAHCLFQGSAYPLENGHVLATCPTSQMIYEYAPNQAEPVFSMGVPCTPAAATLMARGMPLRFDGPDQDR